MRGTIVSGEIHKVPNTLVSIKSKFFISIFNLFLKEAPITFSAFSSNRTQKSSAISNETSEFDPDSETDNEFDYFAKKKPRASTSQAIGYSTSSPTYTPTSGPLSPVDCLTNKNE